jgi:hypothetical protein
MNADPHRTSELGLRKAYEAPECSKVLSGLEAAEHEALADARRYGP